MRLFLTLALSLFTLPLAAHEFWIEADNFQVESGVTMNARLRNGQEFVGTELAYFSRRLARFDRAFEGQVVPIDGRDGDRPAASFDDLPEGLHVFAYASTTERVDYDTMEDFMRFVDHKDLGPVDEMHRARNLPEEGFYEAYSRYAKALVAVGDGAGSDQSFGLAHELIALENPYTGNTSDGLQVALERNGQRRPNAQIELFERDIDNRVTITFHRTNANGVVNLPVRPGHEYLVDAVILFQPSPGVVSQTSAVWETHWAALTFAVPAN